MKKAILTIGVPTSGKSTFAQTIIAEDENFVEISRDKIRRELFGVSGWGNYEPTEANEQLVTDRQYDLIRATHEANKNIIITDTNLRMKYVRGFVSLLEHFGYSVQIKLCEISFMESIRRSEHRSMNTDVDYLRRVHRTYDEISAKVKAKYPEYLI